MNEASAAKRAMPNVVRLDSIADVNPRLNQPLSAGELVSFVPMSAGSAETGAIEDEQRRAYGEVATGFTYFANGDVLVAKITPCFENGKIAHAAISNPVGFGSTEFHVIRPHPDKLDSRYVFHFLRRDQFRRAGERRMTGSAGQRRVPADFISSYEIPVPPLAEQRRIAAILDQADALRAKRRQALAELNTLTQSIFLEMFGDPATNPNNWPIHEVGTVAEVQGGLQVSRRRNGLPMEVPYLRVANVYRSELNLGEVKVIRATEAEVKRTRLERDDMLIVEGHGNPAEIGRAALWDGSIQNCVHQNHLIRARFDREIVLPLYACEFLNSSFGRTHLVKSGKTTSGLNTINVSQVKSAPIPIPPLDRQHEFRVFHSKLSSERAAQVASSQEMDSLFGCVQQRAFKGEL